MIKIKHFLLFLLIIGIIYLEYLFYQNRLKYGYIRDFYFLNIICIASILMVVLPFLNWDKIDKLLNKGINIKDIFK